MQRIENFLAAHPVGNNFLTNLAAGVSRVPAAPFFLGSLLGYVPQTLVFALAGSGVDLGATWRIGIAVALFVASGVIATSLYGRYRHGRTLGAELDEAFEEQASLGSGSRNG